MPNEPWSGAYYTTPTGVAANVPVELKKTTDSIDKGLCPTFSTEAARDAALAPVEGMSCYVTSRKSQCIYTSNRGWQWLSAPQVIYNFQGVGETDWVSVNSDKQIVVTGNLVLAGGNRLLDISAAFDAQGDVVGVNGTGTIVGAVFGNGIVSGNMSAFVQFAGNTGMVSVSRRWMITASGTVGYQFHIIGRTNVVGQVGAYNVFLQITDWGPYN